MSISWTARRTKSSRSVARRFGEMIPRWSRSRSSRSESSRSSFLAFAAILPTMSSASSGGRSSFARSRVSAEPRIEVSGVRRSWDTASRNVFFISSRHPESLRCFSFALERIGVLPFARAQRSLRPLAFGDVDHQASQDRGCAAAPSDHWIRSRIHVADRLARNPVLEGLPSPLSTARCIRPSPPRGRGRRRGSPRFGPRSATPPCRRSRSCVAPATNVNSRPASDASQNAGVQPGDQLVESFELGHPSCVPERERRQVGDAADQPEISLPERPRALPADDRDRAGTVRLPPHRRDEHLAGFRGRR